MDFWCLECGWVGLWEYNYLLRKGGVYVRNSSWAGKNFLLTSVLVLSVSEHSGEGSGDKTLPLREHVPYPFLGRGLLLPFQLGSALQRNP
jgi:hypothetical protein